MDVRIKGGRQRQDRVRLRRSRHRAGRRPRAGSCPAFVGISQALEWSMTARVFKADEALRGGLVRSVHPPDELLPAAQELAEEIVTNAAPISVALTRQMMWRMLGADDPMEAHKIDSRGIYARGRSRRRQGRRGVVPGKAPGAIQEQGFVRHARLFPVVAGARV